MKWAFSFWNIQFQGKSHTTPDIPSEATTENNSYMTSLNMVDLLCFSSHGHCTLVKLQVINLAQKEGVTLFVTLLSYHRTEMLI